MVEIDDGRACRACYRGREEQVRTMARICRRRRDANLEQAVEEGDVVGPFLQRRVEERQGSFDAVCIFSIVPVFRRRILYGGIQSQHRINISHKAQVASLTTSQLVPPLTRPGGLVARALGRRGTATRIKRHGCETGVFPGRARGPGSLPTRIRGVEMPWGGRQDQGGSQADSIGGCANVGCSIHTAVQAARSPPKQLGYPNTQAVPLIGLSPLAQPLLQRIGKAETPVPNLIPLFSSLSSSKPSRTRKHQRPTQHDPNGSRT